MAGTELKAIEVQQEFAGNTETHETGVSLQLLPVFVLSCIVIIDGIPFLPMNSLKR